MHTHVKCPECRGRRKMDYKEWPPEPTAPCGAEEPQEVTVKVLRDQPCRTCKGLGLVVNTEPVAVMQDGRQVGTVPPSFDPRRIKSTSFLYSPRPGDFTREGDHWVASRTLGPGDLEAVPGFVWNRS